MGKNILISLIFFILAGKITSQQVRFGQLSIENGLSDNVITCLLQDYPGFSWFGTEGLDKGWNYNETRQFITYINLGSGSYVFKVKTTNSDGISSKNAASIINPPWWKTTWAYLGYIFLIILTFYVIFRLQNSRRELRNELKIKEFEAKKSRELENLKSRFFTNLFHEFRTPLMLVKGPVEQLINNQLNGSADEEIEQLKMILRNSQKLQELIDQLLDMSRLESASIPLKAKQENLIFLLCGIASAFDPLAKEKNITLIFNCPEDKLCAWIDRDKFEKIINNLLSNAVKFTNEGGRVSIDILKNKITNEAEVKIKDTGIGIPADQLEKIFDRFYQADGSLRRAFGGSGIGLALVKELIELHNWEISVKSEIDKGTEVTVMIPLGDYLEENEKIQEEADSQKITPYTKSAIATEDKGLKGKTCIKISPSDCDSILIVEDSKDVRKYLSDILNSSTFEFTDSLNIRHPLQMDTNGRWFFHLLEAENGEEGLVIAAEEMPDLIISDILMPVMDGIEFCKRLKTNWETSHIPVVLLTAKASSDSKIEGLETGADDYLTKPFESKELLIRIKNLLEQRKRLKEKFSREIKVTPESITTNSLDNEFLNKAIKLAEKNLANTEFDSEAFAKEMFVSRSQLHRKLKAITGLATREFLTSFRLKKAAQMLLEKRLSITQIALEVGFSSHSHFTKAFHKQFDSLPSEFVSKAGI
ncbi:MAG: ATP-binding protein [Ignavibacteriales bacterium]